MLSAWLVVTTSVIASAIHVVGSTAMTAVLSKTAVSHVHLRNVSLVQSHARRSVLQDALSQSASLFVSNLAASLSTKSVAAHLADLLATSK